MVTVAEKQQEITQRFGISNEQFAKLFQEQTGQALSPDLMGQDYDSLKGPVGLKGGKAPETAFQKFKGELKERPVEMAKEGLAATVTDPLATLESVAGSVAETGSVVLGGGKRAVELVGDLARGGLEYGQYMMGLADEEKNRFARLAQIDEELGRLAEMQDRGAADPARSRQITELQKQRSSEAARTRKELAALGGVMEIYDQYGKEVEDFNKRTAYENFVNDGQEFVEAFPTLIGELVTITDANGSMSMIERIGKQRTQEGFQMGQGLVDGLFGYMSKLAAVAIGSQNNFFKGKKDAYKPLYDFVRGRPVSFVSTLIPMKIKLKNMAASGHQGARALLGKMDATGALSKLDELEAGTKSWVRTVDELPARTVQGIARRVFPESNFMPRKERPMVIGKTDEAATRTGLFETDATTTPLRISDVANSALKGAGYGLLAGEPGVGAAIGAFVETTFGIGRNSRLFNESVATVGRYLRGVNAGRTISEQVAKQQLTDDAAKIRDFLEARGLPLRALAEEGKLLQRRADDPRATGQGVSPILEIDDVGVVREGRPRAGERLVQADDVDMAYREALKKIDDAEAQFENSLATFGDEALSKQADDIARAREGFKKQRQELEAKRARDTEAATHLEQNQRMIARDLLTSEIASPLSREAAKIVREIARELEGVGVSPNRGVRLREVVTDIGNGGISLLRSEKFMNAVLDELVSGLGGRQKARARAALSTQLSSMAETAYVGGRRVMPVVRVGKQQIDLIPTISKVLESLDPKKKGGKTNRRKVQAEVIAKVIQEESIGAMGKARSKAMNLEAARPLIAAGMKVSEALDAVRLGKVVPEQYAKAVLTKALDGETMPQVLPRNVDPSDLASIISRLKNDRNFVRDLMAGRQRRTSAVEVQSSVARRADNLIDDLLKNYAEETFNYRSRADNVILGTMFEKVKPKTVREIQADLVDQGIITNPALRKQMEAALEASGVRGLYGKKRDIQGRTISKSLQSTLNMLDDIQHSASYLNQFFNYMKLNLTVYRLATGVNNLASNVWFQGIRRGDPIGTLVRGVSLARRYQRYTEGKYKPANKIEAAIFRQIEESGVAKTNLLDAELDVIRPGLGALGEGAKFSGTALLDRAKSTGKKALEVAMIKRPLEAFYRLGDNIFKIEEMHTAMRSLYRDLDALKVGDYIEFRTAPNTFARITRKRDGFYQGKRKLGGINDKRIAKIFGAAGRRSAVDMFVDYSSRPGLVRKLQNLGPLSLASPFLTWHFKAMGMGEKGFLSRALAPDALIRKTNNRAVAARQANQLMMQMLRRQAIVTEARREMNEDRRFFKEQMAYIPGETRATIFADIADPRYTRAMYLGGQDFMSSEATKIAMIGRVIGAIGDVIPDAPKEAIEAKLGLGDSLKRDRELFRTKKEAGSLAGPASFARLVGLGGQPLAEEVLLLAANYRSRGGKPDINGTPMSTPEIIKRYATFALPSTSRVLAEELLRQTGMIDEQSRMSDRWKTFNPTDPAGHERALEYLVRQLFGIGFKPVALTGKKGAMTRYLNRADRELNTAFNQALKIAKESAKDDPSYEANIEELRRLKIKAATISAKVRKQVMEDYGTVIEGRRKRMAK